MSDGIQPTYTHAQSKDIAQWAKTPDLQDHEKKALQALREDGVIKPENDSKLGAFMQTVESLRTASDADKVNLRQKALDQGASLFDLDSENEIINNASSTPLSKKEQEAKTAQELAQESAVGKSAKLTAGNAVEHLSDSLSGQPSTAESAKTQTGGSANPTPTATEPATATTPTGTPTPTPTGITEPTATPAPIGTATPAPIGTAKPATTTSATGTPGPATLTTPTAATGPAGTSTPTGTTGPASAIPSSTSADPIAAAGKSTNGASADDVKAASRTVAQDIKAAASAAAEKAASLGLTAEGVSQAAKTAAMGACEGLAKVAGPVGWVAGFVVSGGFDIKDLVDAKNAHDPRDVARGWKNLGLDVMTAGLYSTFKLLSGHFDTTDPNAIIHEVARTGNTEHLPPK